MYHDVATVSTDFLTIGKADFARQMAWLADNYQPLTLQMAIDAWQKNRSLSDGVLITFDDGYVGIYDFVWPILNKYNVPAVFFLTTDYLGQDNNWNTRADTIKHHLSASEVQEMAGDSKISFGAHGLTHHRLTKFTKERIKKELQGSKTFIEMLTDRPVLACAYPYGSFNEQVLAIARELFHLGFAANHDGEDNWRINPHALRRIYIHPRSTLVELKTLLKV